MQFFTVNRVPAINVGAGRLAEIGADVTNLARGVTTVLLVADPALADIGITARAERALCAAGHRVVRFEDFTSDPKESQVAAGARAAWDGKAQVVVGLGGGSALDAAKMMAAMAVADRPVEEFRMAAAVVPERRARLLCIPTTAGTGSETTAVSILTGPDGTKFWFWGDALKPDMVVLDAELTVGLPPALTAATGLDALVHAIEAATNRHTNIAVEHRALSAIQLAVEWLPKAVAQPDDLVARTRMLLSASTAGITIDNAGTALAHNIGHALGSMMPIHHGRAVAIAMAATLPWVIEGNRDAFGRVAAIFGLDRADDLPGRFNALLDDLHVDRALPSPIDAATLARRMAAPENAVMLAATARDVTPADIERLAEAVLAATTQPCEPA